MPNRDAEINIGADHIVIERRYRALGAFNDLLIAVWFLVGSIFFFYDKLMTDGTGLFVAGSLQLLLRPLITLCELIHVTRARKRSAPVSHADR